ncbi:MAG: HD-GYP domain-containing protein [Sulfuricella denitrificans]|nr:HD-GYP domain-containing protein [Sulfuricella denitrificans]
MTEPATAHACTCRSCGTDIAAGLHLQDEEDTLCENCFLDQARHAPAWVADEMPYVSLAEALAAALDAREHETGLHSKRVACHTMVLAKRFSDDAKTLRQVYWGALLHDIGKIGIPDAILLKEGPLTPEEWKIMQQHPEIGKQILSGVPHLAQAAEIVLSHEERFDGSGYPQGLAGEAIPLWARLFAIIDTLDAMTSDRSYRKGRSFENAKIEIRRMSGTQFDPVAVEAFLGEEPTLRKMVELKCTSVPSQPEILPSEKM